MKHLFLAVPMTLLPAVAMAHPGHGFGMAAGFYHPFLGLDHLLAMTGLGLWASAQAGAARLALPAGFTAAMAFGWALLPGMTLAEPVILASVLLLSAFVALGVRLPFWAGLALVLPFGLAHGAAHGAEGSGAAFAVGMIGATLALHGFGLALGRFSPATRRGLGGFGLAAGLALTMAG